MAGIISEIDNLKADIEKTGQALRSLYQELGKVCQSYHEAIGFHPSDDAYSKVRENLDKRSSVQDHISTIRKNLENISESEKKISATTVSLRDLEKRLVSLTSALGAVASEIDAQGLLPQELSHCLSSLRDFEKRADALVEKRQRMDDSTPGFIVFITDKRLEACRRNINSMYLQAGKSLLDQPLVETIDNPKVKDILKEISGINKSMNTFNSVLLGKDHADTQSLAKDQTNSLNELLSYEKDVIKALDDSYESYGEILADNMETWLGRQAPSIISSVCVRIRTELKRLEKQNLNLQYLEAQKEICISQGQVNQIQTQLSHLNNQKNNLEKQIEELENRLSGYQTAIENLKKKQEEIAKEAVS